MANRSIPGRLFPTVVLSNSLIYRYPCNWLLRTLFNLAAVFLLLASFQTPLRAGSGEEDSALAGLRGTVYSATALELFWDRPGVMHRYRVERDGRLLAVTEGVSFFDDGLTPNTRYQYRVTAVAGNINALDPSVPAAGSGLLELQTHDDGCCDTVAQVHTQSDVEAAASGDEPQVVPITLPAPVTTQTTQSVPATDTSASVTADAVDSRVCLADSLETLQNCARSASEVDAIRLTADLTCTGSSCCAAGSALVRLHGLDGLQINGQGHRIKRQSGHRQCSLLEIKNSRNIHLLDLQLDDDESVTGCQVHDRCPRMIFVEGSSDISFQRMAVSHSKGYAIYIQKVDGFRFLESSLLNSGVLGLYVGHGSNHASRNVVVRDSLFIRNQTNALALLGVVGSEPDDNKIIGNVFIANHRRGQWRVAPRYGEGFTGGGQVYIAEANNVLVKDNVVASGFCENCFVQGHQYSGVSGIEIGLPGQSSVRDLAIRQNRIVGNDAWGIYQNQNSPLSHSVEISGNELLNNSRAIRTTGPQTSNNIESDTSVVIDWEQDEPRSAQWQRSTQCVSSTEQVRPHCDRSSSLFGACALVIESTSDCAAGVTVTGPVHAVRDHAELRVDGWYKTSANAASLASVAGEVCLEFLDHASRSLTVQCAPVHSQYLAAAPAGSEHIAGQVPHGAATHVESAHRTYHRISGLTGSAPAGAAFARLRLRNLLENSHLMFDHFKLSGL